MLRKLLLTGLRFASNNCRRLIHAVSAKSAIPLAAPYPACKSTLTPSDPEKVNGLALCYGEFR
jgi:hypothetical protein